MEIGNLNRAADSSVSDFPERSLGKELGLEVNPAKGYGLFDTKEPAINPHTMS